MSTNLMLEMLATAPYGAYAMNMNQRIMFCNRTAEVLTGHLADQVIGRPCSEVLQNLSKEGHMPVCLVGCRSLRLAICRRVPPVTDVYMLCASGERREMTMTPLLLSDGETGQVILLYLFHEMTDLARAKRLADAAREDLQQLRDPVEPVWHEENTLTETSVWLTSRQLEVLRLVGLGLSVDEIAHKLVVSTFTVRNHVHRARSKLGVSTTLDAVLAARRRGLL